MVTSFSKVGSALSQCSTDFPQGQERMVVEANGCFLFTLSVQILVNKQKGSNKT